MTPVLVSYPRLEPLAEKLSRNLGAEVSRLEFRRFPDGESYVRVDVLSCPVDGRDLVIVAFLDRPDEKMLPLLFAAETLRDLGARQVGLICPYLPYMRQDRRFLEGEAVTSKSFATLISRSFDWLATVDPHLHRYAGLDEIYAIPATVVHAAPAVGGWIQKHVRTPFIIGPDEESEQWVAEVAKTAGAPFAVLRKQRKGDRAVEIDSSRLPEIGASTPVLLDDIISSAQTMVETIGKIKQISDAAAFCIAVHGVFANSAHQNLHRAGVAGIITCNTVPHETNQIDISDGLSLVTASLLETTARAKSRDQQIRRRNKRSEQN